MSVLMENARAVFVWNARGQSRDTAEQGGALFSFRERKIPAGQIRDRRVVEPMPVQPPLAARIDEPVEHQRLEHLFRARPFAAGRKFFPPKIPEPELLPQLATQPARAPLARPAQRHLPEPQAHHGELPGTHFLRRVLLGKGRDLPRRIPILVDPLDALAPRSVLPPVEFAQVRHMPLDHARITQPAIFDDTPIPMDLAILATF
jgi:hypothetical protein